MSATMLIKKYWAYARNVCFQYAWMQIQCTKEDHFPSDGPGVYDRKNHLFQLFLKNRFAATISRYCKYSETAEPFINPDSAPIWVFWFQGESAAPLFIQEAISNIRRNAGKHPVHIVMLDDLHTYIEIPQKILRLFHEKKISAAAFSDVIRIWLLERYGGIWLDATMVITHPFPDTIFEVPFWTAKNQHVSPAYDSRWIDISAWEGYFLASQPHSLHFKFLKSCFEEYYRQYDQVLDYLLINHFAKIARETVPVIAAAYASIPTNNADCESLNDALLRDDHEKVRQLMLSDTYVFKLGRRFPYTHPSDTHPSMSKAFHLLLPLLDSNQGE